MLTAAELTNELLRLRRIWPDVRITVEWVEDYVYLHTRGQFQVDVQVPPRTGYTSPLVDRSYMFPLLQKVQMEQRVTTRLVGLTWHYHEAWPVVDVVRDVARRLAEHMIAN